MAIVVSPLEYGFFCFFSGCRQGHFYKRALFWLVYIMPDDFSIWKAYLPDAQVKEARKRLTPYILKG